MLYIFGVIGIIIAVAAVGLLAAFAVGDKTNPEYRRLQEIAGIKKQEQREVYSLDKELEGSFYQRIIEPVINRLAEKFSKKEKSGKGQLQDLLIAAGSPGNLGPAEFRAVQLLAAMVSITAVVVLAILLGLVSAFSAGIEDRTFDELADAREAAAAAWADVLDDPMNRYVLEDAEKADAEVARLEELAGKVRAAREARARAAAADPSTPEGAYLAAYAAEQTAAVDPENLLLKAEAAEAAARANPNSAEAEKAATEARAAADMEVSGAKRGFALTLVGCCIAGGFSFIIPQFWLKRRVSTRLKEIQKTLPDAIDLLVVSVEAGLGFDMALAKVVDKMEGAISDEFGRALEEMRLGFTRQQALRNILKRVKCDDLESFISAIIQADQLGASIGKILRIQSEQMRVKRRQRVEEAAMKAPVKMLFPMVLFIFPTIFIVVLGPIVLKVMDVKANIGKNMGESLSDDEQEAKNIEDANNRIREIEQQQAAADAAAQ